jgi:mxaD protein
MKNFVLALLGLLLLPTVARADDRVMQVVAESIDIKATPTDVWKMIRRFDGLEAWHPAIPSSPIVKGKDGQVGAVRAVTLKDGPTLTEELLAFNESGMAFTYSIVESPLPIDHYRSTMAVRPNGSDAATVVWIGNFVRKNPRDNVPEGESDAGVAKLISNVYVGGLQNLKKILEK